MRVGNVKEIVFSKDPKQMNWLREDFPYAEVKCPPEFSAEVQNEKDGDVLTTKIVVSYNGAHPYFTNAGSIGVSFPLQDRYTDSVTCRDYRCHAHVFCGENTSYIMALRMGGAAPHLGMVLTKGSLSAYSIERDLKLQSNDRGCFWLHTAAPGMDPVKITQNKRPSDPVHIPDVLPAPERLLLSHKLHLCSPSELYSTPHEAYPGSLRTG